MITIQDLENKLEDVKEYQKDPETNYETKLVALGMRVIIEELLAKCDEITQEVT